MVGFQIRSTWLWLLLGSFFILFAFLLSKFTFEEKIFALKRNLCWHMNKRCGHVKIHPSFILCDLIAICGIWVCLHPKIPVHTSHTHMWIQGKSNLSFPSLWYFYRICKVLNSQMGQVRSGCLWPRGHVFGQNTWRFSLPGWRGFRSLFCFLLIEQVSEVLCVFVSLSLKWRN